MNNINNTLKNEMAVVASLILDEAKNGKQIRLVTVDERKDSSAFTDGSSIIQVPVNFGNVTKEMRSVAYGFLSHEASHCRNTDFSVIRGLKEKYGGLAHRLQNTIEDPRIERIAVLQFPGQKDHLIKTKEHVIAQEWWAGPNPQGICWQECLLSYALYWGNVCVGFACAEPLMQAWENIFNDIFSHYCGKDAPDFIREQIKTAVLADQADATALAVEKILDLILANKDKFRKDLQNLPEESRTTSNSYDLKGLYDEEDQQQSTGNGNSGTGTNGSNAEGESTAEGNGSGAESEDAEGSNADSDGSESAEEDADSNGTDGDTADGNGTEAEDGAESEAEGSDTDGETESDGSETGDAEEETEGSNTDGESEAEGNSEEANDETESSNTDGESEADEESEDADGDNAGSVGSETEADSSDTDSNSNSAADDGADETDGQGADADGSDSEGEGTEAGGASGCTPTFGGVPLDQSKAQQEAEEDAMQKAFKELQSDAANATADNPLPVVTTTNCYNDRMTYRSYIGEHLSDIRNMGLKLRKEFSKKLQNQVLSAKGLKASGTRFSGSHMAGIATGNYKIFESKDFVKKPSASVEILLDISGSMYKKIGRERVIEIAQRAVGALLFGLDIQGIETEFSVFPGVYNRTETGYCVVKRFDDHNTALMLKNACISADGSTPDAYGVMGATINLSKRKNANKICIVLTDGDICQQTVGIMAKGKQSGIKYYGIAINTQLPPFIFEKYVEVLDPTTLPDVLLKLAREVIQI